MDFSDWCNDHPLRADLAAGGIVYYPDGTISLMGRSYDCLIDLPKKTYTSVAASATKKTTKKLYESVAEENVDLQMRRREKKKTENMYKDAYILREKCVFRERELLEIKRITFKTGIVKDLICEYLQRVSDCMENTTYIIDGVKNQLTQSERQSLEREIDTEKERSVAAQMLVDIMFSYLKCNKDLDNTQFIQQIFYDISILVQLTEHKKSELRPKDICKEYFIKTLGGETRKTRCVNCKGIMFKGFNYCFNCFVRN